MGDLRNRLLQALQDPRVGKVLRDPRTQKALMRALRFRGRVQERIDQRLERMARRLNLATAREVRELRRTIRRLEEELRDGTSSQ
ncbi:MAG: hypothetical protein OER77_05770 [Myxococcales bacterium]|nr:hypothetical protein [Myxococcales bacterium]